MPKYPKYGTQMTSGAVYYVSTEIDYAKTVLSDYIKKNPQENGQTYAKYLEENAKAIEESIVNDRIETEGKPSEEAAERFAKAVNPQYRPLNSEDIDERKKRSDSIRKKIAAFAAKRIIAESIGNSTPDKPEPSRDLTRTEQSLLLADTTPEGIEYNKIIAEKLKSGDPEKIKEVYKERIDSFSKIDISKIDLTDDRYLEEHFEELYPILTAGAELAKLVDEYQQYQVMDIEEDKHIFETLGALEDMTAILRLKLNIMASPVYEQLRIEDLLGSNNFLNPDSVVRRDDNGDYMSAEDALFGSIYNADLIYLNGIAQLSNLNSHIKITPFMKTDITKEERAEEFRKEYWNAGEPTVSPEFYTERKNAEEKLRRNIVEIKKIFPKFEFSEEEIKAHVSPQRIRLHKKATKIIDDQKTRRAKIKEIKNKPLSFTRAAFALLKSGSDKETKAYNKKLSDNLVAPGYDAQNFRKELFAECAGRIKALDGSIIDRPAFNEDTANYVLENMDTLEIGVEFQRTNEEKENSMGFSVNNALTDDLKKTENKGVTLGGIGSNYKFLMSNESFLTVPFEKLNKSQISKLISDEQFCKKAGLDPKDLQRIISFKNQIEQGTKYKEPSSHIYVRGDFEDTALPNVTDYKRYIEQMDADLNKTDHWYNRSSSSAEYNNFRESVRNMRREFSRWPGDADPEKIVTAWAKLKQDARKYMKHVESNPKPDEKEGKNKNQKARYTVAKNFDSFSSGKNIDINILAMAKYEANLDEKTMTAHRQALEQEQHECQIQAGKDLQEYEEWEKNRPLSEKEKIGKKIEEKTNHIRTEINKLRADSKMHYLKSREVFLRESLAEAVAANVFDVDFLAQELAALLVNGKMQKVLTERDEAASDATDQFQLQYREQADIMAQSPAFKKMLETLTGDELAHMLQEDSEPNSLLTKVLQNLKESNKAETHVAEPSSFAKQGPSEEKIIEISTSKI